LEHSKWLAWWRDRGASYFTDKIWKFSRPDLIDRLKIGPTTSILELGYGYGREIEQFCRLSSRVAGLDLSESTRTEALRLLEKRGRANPMPSLGVYTGRKIPYPDNFFGVVYSCYVIQHLSRRHAMDLMRESLRVVNLEGHILFEFFGDPDFHDDNGGDAFSGDPDFGGMFNNAYRPSEIQTAIEAIGGVLDWLEPWPINNSVTNWWACFGK